MQTSELTIRISVRDQRLDLREGGRIVASYPVSTSRFGLGTAEGSFKTPLGRFKISEKIGEGLPVGTVFRGRVPLAPNEPLPASEDLILSRILWLDGLEAENANTHDRFIYIHGTRHEDKIGQPDSHGCVRMKSADLLAFFARVPLGAEVIIEA
jgi:lipoprotein-anchoring transpeptidase ErfK/SrfK